MVTNTVELTEAQEDELSRITKQYGIGLAPCVLLSMLRENGVTGALALNIAMTRYEAMCAKQEKNDGI